MVFGWNYPFKHFSEIFSRTEKSRVSSSQCFQMTASVHISASGVHRDPGISCQMPLRLLLRHSRVNERCMLNFWLTATEFCQCYVSAGEGQKGLESVLIGQFTYSFSGADVCVELQKIWSCCGVWCISTALQKVRTHHGTFSMQICRPERCCRLPPLCRWGQRCRGHWKYLKSRERDDEWCNIQFFFSSRARGNGWQNKTRPCNSPQSQQGQDPYKQEIKWMARQKR